jgi:phosphomannomutase
VKGKVGVGSLNSDKILSTMQERYSHEGTVTTTDGLKLDFPDSWVHLRKSNTEPIIRIIAEAPTRQQAASLVSTFTNQILAV